MPSGMGSYIAWNNDPVPVRSHRPSRSLREEPVTHVLLTLAKLAHPQWNLRSHQI